MLRAPEVRNEKAFCTTPSITRAFNEEAFKLALRNPFQENTTYRSPRNQCQALYLLSSTPSSED